MSKAQTILAFIDTTCSKCGKVIAKDDKAWWVQGTKDVWCPECHADMTDEPIKTITMFDATCCKCNTVLPKGALCVWVRGEGIQCEKCGTWYSVVAFGPPTRNVTQGTRVSRDLSACIKRATFLKRAGCPTVRVVECSTRQEARDADISETRPVAYHA